MDSGSRQRASLHLF